MSNIAKDIATKTRIEQLKAMHSLMCNANDERIYMTWAMGWIPDCPMEEDFFDCAEDDERYNETVDKFISLISKSTYRW